MQNIKQNYALLVFDKEALNTWTNKRSRCSRLQQIITYDPKFEYKGIRVGDTVEDVLEKHLDVNHGYVNEVLSNMFT
jgi:hypothetical protein